MRVFAKYAVWGLSLWVILFSWGSQLQASVGKTNIEPVGGSADRFSFRLNVPAPSLAPDLDGTYRVTIDGFDTRERTVGAPDLPVRTVLVAIPPGAAPTLVVHGFGERLRPGIRPRAALDPREAARRGRDQREPDEVWPPQVAWLGEIGYLRDQRYVKVHLAPLRWDERRRALVTHDALEVEVRFNAPAGSSATRPPDPRFEPTYREAFVNYSQGLAFRGSPAADAVTITTDASRSLDGGGPRRRIAVRQTGVVRLDHTRVAGSGFEFEPLSTWKLTSRGETVPLRIFDDGDDLLEPGEWVEFWGQALDDEPKTVLNTDIPGTDFDLFAVNDFGDENVYFLEIDPLTPAPMTTRDAAPTLTRTPPSDFAATARAEVDSSFRPLGGADPWYWGSALTLASASTDSRIDAVPLPGLASGTLPLSVRVRMRGSSRDDLVFPDHGTRVTLRNSGNAVVTSDESTFDSYVIHTQAFDWNWRGAGAQATNPLSVELEVLDVGATCGTGSPCNSVYLDFIEIDYRRAFTAAGGRLVFEWPDADAEFVVVGLSDSAPEIWELRDDGSPIRKPQRLLGAAIGGGGPFSARFRVDEDPALPDGTPRTFVVFDGAAATVPSADDFSADTLSDLRDPANQADLIVIGHPDALDDTPGSPLTQLLAHRASPAGGGLSSKVVRIRDVYDEFNAGLAEPHAIREFLRFVLSDAPGEGWASPKPAYVLLIGDGSWDYKGGPAQGNLVPTYIILKNDQQLGYYASDNLLAAVQGDDSIPDVMIGRISARSSAEAGLMLDKILDYETTAPGGSWRSHALTISDRGKLGNNPAEALQFEMLNDAGLARMPRPPYTSRHLRYWTDYYDTPDPFPWDSINSDIKLEVNGGGGATADGAAIVQFVGHGNFFIWSDDFFWDERIAPPGDTFQDTMELFNATRLPWLMAHNCLTGGFHLPFPDTVGETWFRRQGGGSMGVFAPSGLSFNFIGDVVIETVWGGLFGPRKQRMVGTAALETALRLCTQGSTEACQYYVLLGDPATRLQLPHVDPPRDVVASGENAQVVLDWTASATPGARYTVYRASQITAATVYTKLNATPLTEPTFTDSGVVNARTYYYYVLATDLDGFESAWSNFNSDCAVAGPDCVQATPLNPNAPVPPGGIALADPGLGNVLELTWSPNPENDIAGYVVNVGTESGVYTTTLDVGRQHRTVLQGLEEGQSYFFTVQAENTSGLLSAMSAEVDDFPVFGLGLRSPAFISDLRLGAAGDDIVLEWSEVVTDVYGKPKSVALYEIFRGDVPDFSAAATAKVGECVAPCSGFTDPGARALPGGLHYRVRAVDVESNVGGLGFELPASVELSIGKGVAPGAIVLEWPAVDAAVDGSATRIAHYAIYAADQPFTRADIRDGLLPPPTTVPGTSFELTPPAQARYYSVLAVDEQGNASPF